MLDPALIEPELLAQEQELQVFVVVGPPEDVGEVKEEGENYMEDQEGHEHAPGVG